MGHWLAIIGAGLIAISIHPINTVRWWLMYFGILLCIEAMSLYVYKQHHETRNKIDEIQRKEMVREKDT